jgi:hypothetical protein
VELELYNLEATPMAAGFEVSVAGVPDWIRGVVIDAVPTAPIEPGGMLAVRLRFDVTPGIPSGAQGEIGLTITDRSGFTWHEAIPVTVAEGAESIQSDCCTALEIGTTSVAAGSIGQGTPAGELRIQSFPNPSNPFATIRFSLANAGPVSVSIHDVTGRLVRTLSSGAHDAGVHEFRWDGRDDDRDAVESGIYLVRVVADGKTSTAKLVVTR